MEETVTNRLVRSAKLLGIPRESGLLAEAIHIGELAIADGRTEDEAFEFARNVLIKNYTAA